MLYSLWTSIALFIALLLPCSQPLLVPSHSQSIVQIYSPLLGSGGTGYELEYQGREFLVTNAHVCAIADVEGNLTAVGPFMYPQVVHVLALEQEGNDLCILTPLKGWLPPLHLGTHELRIFENFYTTGYPDLGPLKTAMGTALREMFIAVEGQTKWSYLANVLTIPGCSGSPVFNMHDEVVGTIYAGNSSDLGLFIPLQSMKSFLNAYIAAH